WRASRIRDTLDPLFADYARGRQPGEHFGDYLIRYKEDVAGLEDPRYPRPAVRRLREGPAAGRAFRRLPDP
ncbi:hypothetical protein CTI14_71605, partial [Methylobacterium radiotolerans]